MASLGDREGRIDAHATTHIASIRTSDGDNESSTRTKNKSLAPKDSHDSTVRIHHFRATPGLTVSQGNASDRQDPSLPSQAILADDPFVVVNNDKVSLHLSCPVYSI